MQCSVGEFQVICVVGMVMSKKKLLSWLNSSGKRETESYDVTVIHIACLVHGIMSILVLSMNHKHPCIVMHSLVCKSNGLFPLVDSALLRLIHICCHLAFHTVILTWGD